MLCCFELLVCEIQIQPLFDIDSLKAHFWLLCNGKTMLKLDYYEEADISDPFTIFLHYHLGTSKSFPTDFKLSFNLTI